MNTPQAMRCAAALSTLEDSGSAAAEVCEQALAALDAEVHLAVLFASPPHAPHLRDVAARVCDAIGGGVLVGCTGESIVGGEREIEGEPAISLWLAHLPGATIEPMHLTFQRTAEGGTFTGWPESFEPWPEPSSLVLVGEPFSFPADALLERLNEDQPGVPVVGGMASGGFAPGENLLLLGRDVYDQGAVALRLSGALRLRTIVSQGCRPIGRTFVITKAEQNVILELGGKPALAQLGEIFPTLSPREQGLIRSGLHVGRVTSEYQEQFSPGDFLVRNVVGADPESGAIAVGDFMRTGQTVQFHIRDQQTADEDLKDLLEGARNEGAQPAGALVFTCNGRGTRLFTEPHHDARAVSAAWPDLPTAGFFAQGEIGPIGQKNFLHGFTASIALIEPRS